MPRPLATWNPARDVWEGGATQHSLRALGRVLGDLSSLGYDAQWSTIRASDIGTPHHRERVFILAHRRDTYTWRERRSQGRTEPAQKNQLTTELTNLCERDGRRSETKNHTFPFNEFTQAVEHWENILGRAAPPAGTLSKTGTHRLNPVFVEWLMGLPEGWVTDPAYGLTRAQQLKALGNGVVPQQAASALSEMWSHLEETPAQKGHRHAQSP